MSHHSIKKIWLNVPLIIENDIANFDLNQIGDIQMK